MLSRSKLWILSASAAMVVAFSVNIAFAAWTGPTLAAPNGNTAAPINVSATDQTKTGGLLNVWNLWVNNSLGVTGGVTASQYCFSGGSFCIAKWPASQWTTSGTSIYYNGGNVGIGTASPLSLLQVGSGGSTTYTETNTLQVGNGVSNSLGVVGDSSGSNVNLYLNGTADRKATIRATLDGTQGGDLGFWTKPDSTSVVTERMHIGASGNVGIGTASPNFPLTINTNNAMGLTQNAYNSGTERSQSIIRTFVARGTATSPTKTLRLDGLMSLHASGFWTGKANGYFIPDDGRGGINILASEDWIGPSNNGTMIDFLTTPNGSSIPQVRVRFDHDGKVGIGTENPLAKLHVAGNIRVGTSGTNGCLQNFGGGVIVGTCSSDMRLKEVTGSVGNVLNGISNLNLVTFHWNDTAASMYHNDISIANTGFIAQEVQKQFPELVTTDENGYYQLDYSTLNLYSIEAVKELAQKVDTQQKEIDALKADIEALKNKN